MKSKNRQDASVTAPLLKDLTECDKANNLKNPTIDSNRLAPSDLYQEDGGGYNLDFTFPQE